MFSTKKTTLITIAAFVVITAAALASSAALRETAGEKFDSVREFLGIAAAPTSTTAPEMSLAQQPETAEPMVFAGVTYYSQGSLAPNTLANWNTVRGGGGSTPANFTGGDIFVIQNGHNMTTNATWSVSGASSKVWIENGGTLTATFAITLASATTFQIDNGGTYAHGNNTAYATTIFQGTELFAANSTVILNNSNTTGPSNVTFGNLTINFTADPGGAVNSSGGISTINGNLTVISTSTREFRLTGSAALTLGIGGNVDIQGGTLNFANGAAATAVINIGGNYSQSGGTFTSPGAVTSINFTGSGKTFVQSAGTLTSTNINWTVNSGASLTLANNLPVATSRTFTVNGTLNCGTNFLSGAGNFSLSSGATLGIGDANGITTSPTLSGNIQVTGSRTFNTGANYSYNGSAAQSTGNGLPATVNDLTINNSSGVTLSGARSVAGTLTLTSGNLITDNTNLLSITNTAAGAVSGGSAGSYVKGPIARAVPTSSSPYVFPIGDGGYNPLELQNPGVSGGSVTVKASVVDASSGGTAGTGMGTLKTNRYWNVSQVGTFNSVAVKLTDSTVAAGDLVGRSTTGQTGAYDAWGGTVSGSTITSNSIPAVGFFNIGTSPPPTLGTYGNTSVGLSGNTTVTPSATPANTTSIVVASTAAFKGALSANTSTGIVRVMNAHPAGTYPVTVTAFGPGGPSTATFNLTVTDGTPCGGATSFSFAPAATVAIGTGTYPRAVAVGDLNGDGIQDVVSANTTSSNISVLLGNGSGGFGAAANFAMGFSPTGIALGDMNGDGRLDVMTANSGGDVSYRPGAAGGTFGALTNLTVGTSPTSVVIGDFNADGKLDFATANSGSNNVSLRLGDGAGGFAAATNFAVGTQPITVATGDFNGDGKLDLTTANISSSNVSILLGNGVGGFAAAVNYAAGTAPISVAAGDINGDGNPDLAVANQGGLPGVGVLMGTGAGAFGPRTGYPGGVLPAAVAFGDFNNDGKLDIAAGDQNGPTVPILLGDGAGGFEYTRNFTVGTSPRSIAVADLNGDGRQDIISGNSGSDNLSVLLGTCITPEANLKGNGVSIADGDVTPSLADHTDFGPAPIFSTVTRTFTIENTGTGELYLTQPNKVSITGANADQFQMVLPPASNVIAPGGSATFNVDFYPTSPGLKTAVISIANSDTDENPYDFVIQGTATASYTVTYDGNGNTGGTAPTDPNSPYTYPATVTVLGNTGALVRTNYNFNGWNTQSDGSGTTYQPADTFSITADTTLYAVWTPTPPTIGTYSGASIVMSDNGVVTPGSAPTFTTSVSARTDTRFKGTLAANPATGAVTVTNAYPSGIYPVTVTAFGLGGSVSTTFNLTVNAAGCGGTSGLGPVANSAAGTAPKSVAVGDFNGDGNQDLVTANSGSANVSVMLGTGSGTFSAATSFTVGTTPQSVAVGDFNGDGRQDIVAANYGSNSVSLLLGNGAGSFAPKTDTSLGAQTPYMLALADINGDGRQDVVTANVTGSVSILFGTGSGTFTLSTQFVSGSVPVSVAAGDFNNDGKQDLVVAHSSAGFVTIMPGNGDGTFGIFTTFASGPFSASVAVGDLNGDGKQDLAVANSSAGTISVLAGNGSGGFGAATPFTVGTTPLHVATADLNGDGNLDLISANSASNNMSVLTGNGSGSFAAAVNYGTGTSPNAVAVGDINGDGFQDIAAANSGSNNVSVRLGTCMTSVTYNGNGSDSGSVPVDPASYAVGSTVTVLGNTGGLSRNGYDFSGWNTAPDGSGTSYAPSGTFTINANTTLYAKWAIKQYTLTYNGNGNTGGTAPAPVTQNYNTTVAAAAAGTLTKTGYAFTGWNTAANGSGAGYAVGAPFTFTATTTLYAQWIVAPVITLDTGSLAFGNGNTGFGSAPQSKAISGANLTGNITCTAPADFQVSSNGTSWGSTATFTQSGGSASGTLRTRFNPGSTGVKTGSISCTSNFAAAQSFTAGGTGFNPQYRGGRIDWQKSGIANITFTAEAAFKTSDFGAVAINDLIDVGADFDYGDGTALEDVRLKVTSVNASEGWFYGMLVKVGGGTLTYTYPTANATYKAVWKGTGRLLTATNFSTSDWRLAADVKIETVVTTTRSSRSTVVPVLYVQDNSIVSFTLPINSYDSYATTATAGTAGDFVANPAVPSAQFVPPGLTVSPAGLISWDIRDIVQAGIASGQTYYLAVTLDNGHGTISPVEIMVSVTPAAVLNLDLTALDFGSVTIGANSAGQSKAISGSNLPTDILCQSTPDYQVSSNGTVWNSSATITQSGGNASGTLYTRFSPTSGGAIPGQVQCSSGTAVFKIFDTAGIGVAPSYTVTFNSNGGSGTMANQTANTPTALTANAFTRTGYTFAGWGTSPGGPAIFGNGATYSFAANITLYAQWTINQYTLTYNAGAGGTISGITPQPVNHGASGSAVTAVPNPGFAFVNWSDLSTANPRTDTNVTGPITVTANFVATYTLGVTTVGSGSVTKNPDQASYNNGTVVELTAVPDTGWTFNGWSGDTEDLNYPNRVPLVIITGESNSGGYAVNADATVAELSARPGVQILNNNSLLFEDLDIGTNNLIGHAGLPENATHGFELGLANSVDASEWPNTPVYLVKTGQGGSTISQWTVGSPYWTTFNQRVTAAVNNLTANGKTPMVYILYSHGINDALLGTPVATWKNDTIAHLAKIRRAVGPSAILMTRLMSPAYDTYNTAIDEIAAADDLTLAIDVTGATLRDANHWDYAGMKLIASRMVTNMRASGGGAVTANPLSVTMNRNRSLTAHFVPSQYTLTYNGNGNTGGTAPGTVTQNYNTSVSVAGQGTLSRSGYTFGGWNTASDGSGTSYAPSSTFTFPAANTTLYAVWVPITYQLTVNAGTGGTINEPGTSPATVDHGSPTTIIAVANVGYTFTNWTVTAGSASIANASSAVTTVTLTSGNATVQANFTPLPTVQLSGSGTFFGIEGSTATVTVTRTGDTTGTSTVNYQAADGTATAGTCGVAGVDYVSTSGTLTFNPTDTSKTFTVTLCSDAVVESPAETIGLVLTSPTGATLGTPDDGSITIIDVVDPYVDLTEIDTPSGSTASAYPATINVSGYTGLVGGLTLSLYGVTQPFPDDIDILLVSPDGTRKIVLMSYAGGSTPIDNITMTFDDTAATFIPDEGAIIGGSKYKPTNCLASVPDFPAPAPAGPYSLPGCSGAPAATMSSVFGGMNPNGVWKLYVRDHSTPFAPDSPSVNHGGGHHYGWGIHFTPFSPTASDVSVAGRVLTAGGAGIRNVRITVSGGDLAQPLTAVTGAFGYYRVEGLTAGETYVVTVASKNYAFEMPSRIVTLGDSVAGLDFTARP